MARVTFQARKRLWLVHKHKTTQHEQVRAKHLHLHVPDVFALCSVCKTYRYCMGPALSLGTPSLHSIEKIEMFDARFAESRRARRENGICTPRAPRISKMAQQPQSGVKTQTAMTTHTVNFCIIAHLVPHAMADTHVLQARFKA